MGAKRIVTASFLCLALLLGTIPIEAVDNPWEIMINIPECRLYLYITLGFLNIKVADR